MEQSATSVVKQQVEEPSAWLDEEVLELPVLAEDLSSLTDQQGRNSPIVSADVRDDSVQLSVIVAISRTEEPADTDCSGE